MSIHHYVYFSNTKKLALDNHHVFNPEDMKVMIDL
jgi:hypothetical protein